MERNIEAELDSLKNEIQEIKSLIQSFAQGTDRPETKNPPKNIQTMQNMHPNKHLSALMNELCLLADDKNITGLVTHFGVYSSGGRQANWIRNGVNTDELLGLIENHTAEKVLNCIGSGDRLSILLALLKSPKTVAELVSECKLNSTGQAYHHMKSLLAADLITEDTLNNNKGVYVVNPTKISGIFMLLAGICDLFDTTPTNASWE